MIIIKSWEELEEEFGIDTLGIIPCSKSFVSGMRYLCGKKFKSLHTANMYSRYDISSDMVKLYKEIKW